MILKKYIYEILTDLEGRYTSALTSSNPLESIYYSKLAILEYCGWIEESLDNISRRAAKGKIKSLAFRQMFEHAVIGNNHGFQYKENFRPMLTRTIGISAMEKIENHLNSTGKLATLTSELEAVKKDRDLAAHTWGITLPRPYPSPSITRQRLETLYPILRQMYSLIIRNS